MKTDTIKAKSLIYVIFVSVTATFTQVSMPISMRMSSIEVEKAQGPIFLQTGGEMTNRFGQHSGQPSKDALKN